MKYKLSTFLLVLMMILLIGGVGLFGYLIYVDLVNGDAKQTISEEFNSISTELPKNFENNINNIDENIIQIENANNDKTEIYSSEIIGEKFFYNQLDNYEKIIYKALQENKDNLISGTYVIEFKNEFSDLLKEENGTEELGIKYQAAIDAFMADNPDLFYLDVTKLYLNIKTTKKVFSTSNSVEIGPNEGGNYYNDFFTDELEVRNAISEIEKQKNIVLSKMTNSEYKNIKIIHDYIVSNTKYDQNYESKNTYNIYGALIDHKCVCEGYAKVLKYFANAAGISCEIIKGIATNSEGITEKHAWNCIKLNDNWYYMDITWDDPIVIGGKDDQLSAISYDYFLKGEKSFSKEHNAENSFSINGKEFSYPTISQTDY